jgi:membrane protein YqaA with SNARE-associated domain
VFPTVLRRIYDWVMRLAHHPRAAWALFAVSFAESSFFPIPPDAMLIPMVLADRRKAWFYALICTIASVLGALLGYWIGFTLYETIGKPIIAFYHLDAAMQGFIDDFNKYGLWIILIKGLTPIPYKLVTIASGVAGFALTPFILASIVTRGFRFFLVAGLLYFFGEPIRDFIERRLTLVTTVFIVLVVGGFVALKYLG